MISSATIVWLGGAIWAGGGGEQDWVFLGENLVGAAFKLEVRGEPGEEAAALVSLVNAAEGAEGLFAAFEPEYLDPISGETIGATVLTPLILQSTLEAIDWGQSDPALALRLVYDLQVTEPGGFRRQRAFGVFTLNPGVTL